MPAANVTNIRDFFPELEPKEARGLAEVLKRAETHNEVDAALDYANTLVEGHGVEAIRGDYHVDGYYQDIVALYVNTGDTYSATILYDTERERYYATTFGDWVEKNQKRYSII